jgi:hypothetical protein
MVGFEDEEEDFGSRTSDRGIDCLEEEMEIENKFNDLESLVAYDRENKRHKEEEEDEEDDDDIAMEMIRARFSRNSHD